MIALKTILVPTDFGEAADAALEYGRALARTFHANLVLLHVADDLLARAAASGGMVTELETPQAELDSAAQKDMNARLTDEDRRELGATTVLLVSRSPEWEVLDYAKKHKVDLIVMGTHGRGPWGHLFIGSIAERVVRAAPCPVLTVRHPEREFVLPDALAATARA